MPLYDPVDVELSALRALRDRRQAADAAVASITEDQALLATQIHDFFNWLPPSVSVAFAAAGYTPDSDEVYRIASNYAKNLPAADLAQYGEVVTAEEGKKSGGGILNQLGRAAGNIGGAAKRAALDNWDDPMSKVRGLTRASSVIGNWAPQMAQARYGAFRKDIEDRGWSDVLRDNFTSPSYQGTMAFKSLLQTDLGVAQTQLMTTGEVDTGTGFFITDQIGGANQLRGLASMAGVGSVSATGRERTSGLAAQRQQYERMYSPTMEYADGTVHRRTIGREVADVVGLEPGNRGFNIVSGLGDASVYLGMSKASGAWRQEARLAKQFKVVDATVDADASAFARARESLGAIWSPGRRATFDPDMAKAWLAGNKGKEVVDYLAGETVSRRIDALTGKKLDPEMIRQLADATDTGQVSRILQEAIEKGDIRKQLNVVGGQVAPWKRTRIELKDRLGYRGYRTRGLELMPDRQLDLDDTRAVLDQADRWAASMKLSPQDRDWIHDQLVRVGHGNPLAEFDDVDDIIDAGLTPANETSKIGRKGNRMAKPHLLRTERQQIVYKAFSLGAVRLMDSVADEIKAMADETLAPAVREAAKAKVAEKQKWVEDLLRTSRRVEDAQASYWRDEVNRNRDFFNVIVDDGVNGPTLIRPGLTDVPPNEKLGMRRLWDYDEPLDALDDVTSAKPPAQREWLQELGPVYAAFDDYKKPVRVSPTLIAEHTNRFMTLPDPRAVREAFNTPLMRAAQKIPFYNLTKHTLENLMSKVWVPSHLLRFAFPIRVIGDSQMRIFAEGGDSFFNHPIRAIAWSLGDSKFRDRIPDRLKLGQADARGVMFERHDQLVAGLNNADDALWRDSKKLALEMYAPFTYGQAGFNEALHENLGRLSVDPVAFVLLNSDNMDEARKVWWSEMYPTRHQLAKAHPQSARYPGARSGRVVLTKPGADAYLDEVAERLNHITGGDERLINAVRQGGLSSTDPDVIALAREGGGEIRTVEKVLDDGTVEEIVEAWVPMYIGDGHANPVFTKVLETDFADFAQQRFTTRELVGRAIPEKGSRLERGVETWDHAVTKLFSMLMGNPDNLLDRSPFMRQRYYDRIRERVALLRQEDVEALVRNVENAGLPRDQLRTIKRLAGRAGKEGKDALSLDELHAIAIAHAIDDSQELLYDLTKRHQIADAFKLIAPFGEAWAEVINVWTRQLARPERWGTLSRAANTARSDEAGQVIGEKPGRGVFWRDENGNEMLTFPLSRQMLGAFGVPDVPMVGKVQGLSVGFEIMPGLGPVAQVPLAMLNDNFDDPKYDPLRDMLFPYGVPRGSFAEVMQDQMLPAWISKVANVNGGLDPESWGSTVIDASRFNASTGEFAVSGEGASKEEVRRMIDKSKTDARWMTVLRGLAQMVAPTSPSYAWEIEDKSGNRVGALTLAKELQALRDDPDPEVADNAIITFLERHGEGAFALLQGKTIAVSPAGALPPTKPAADWLARNKFAQSDYPATYGLFAPRSPDDKFDSNVYWRLVEGNERASIDPEVAIKLANRKVAQAVYYSFRNKFGENLTPQQSAGLYELRQMLEERYPGYSANGDPVPDTPNKFTTPMLIEELEKAVVDPRLAKNALTEPLAAYLELRQMAVAASKAATKRDESWTTSKQAAGVRSTMFQAGSRLAQEYPAFKSAWESVLLPEFDRALVDDAKEGN